MGELRTGTDHLLGHIDGDVAVLSFNRPDRRNALSEEINLGFATALEQVGVGRRRPAHRLQA